MSGPGRVAPRAPSSTERAHRTILDRIIDGTYPAESMLSENELAASLGMSRTPVRGALSRLQADGWIAIYPKRGALVRALAPAEIADIADARLVLEISGVARATPAARRALARELTPSVDEQDVALARGEVATFIESTLRFHNAFVEAGGNRYLIEVGNRIADRQRQMLFAHQDSLLARRTEIVAEHRHLLDCLASGEADAFSTALRGHVADTLGLELNTR